MDPRYREIFNKSFSPALYERVKRDLQGRLQTPFEFRLAETPVFLPDDLKARLTRAASEIVDQLSDSSRLEKMKRAIPARWDTPGMDALPTIAQVDLAIVRDSSGSIRSHFSITRRSRERPSSPTSMGFPAT